MAGEDKKAFPLGSAMEPVSDKDWSHWEFTPGQVHAAQRSVGAKEGWRQALWDRARASGWVKAALAAGAAVGCVDE